MKQTSIFLIISLVLIFSSIALSQNSDEPRYDEFEAIFNKPYLRIGALIQVVGDFQFERTYGTDGFNISNARLKLSGDFDKGVGYLLQTSFTNSPVILDASVYYKLSDPLVFNAGLFKAPFSREYLTSAANIDFVNRSQVVSNLAPNRQIGFQVGGTFSELNLNYSVGMFNGNKFANNSNDNNKYMYAGRIAYTPSIKSTEVEIAFNVAQSTDSDVNIPSIESDFNGKRLLIGADTRINFDKTFLSGEVIYANIKPSIGNEIKPFGYQATVGYMLVNNLQALLRWDSYKLDNNFDSNNQVIIGFNFWPTKISELQFNYVMPTTLSIKNYQILLNAQVSL